MATVWRLIAANPAHQQQALQWISQNHRVFVGWCDIGDIAKRGYRSMSDIRAAVRASYPMNSPATVNDAQSSLINLYSDMRIDDLVILNSKKGRERVVQISGDYEYFEGPRSGGVPYRHQRAIALTNLDPDSLWHKSGEPAMRQNLRWTLIRLQNQV